MHFICTSKTVEFLGHDRQYGKVCRGPSVKSVIIILFEHCVEIVVANGMSGEDLTFLYNLSTAICGVLCVAFILAVMAWNCKALRLGHVLLFALVLLAGGAVNVRIAQQFPCQVDLVAA